MRIPCRLFALVRPRAPGWRRCPVAGGTITAPPAEYLRRLAAARIPTRRRGRRRQAGRRRHAAVVGEPGPADESRQHDENRDHLLGAAPAGPGATPSAPRCSRTGRWRATSCAARCTCAAAAIRTWSSRTCGCWSRACAASASATSAATWCSTRRCSSRWRTIPGQFDGEEGRAYNVGPDALLVNFKSIAVTFVPDTAARVARVMVVPEVAGLKYPRMVPAVEGGCGDWRARLKADINDPMNIRIGGSLSTGLRRTRHLPRRARTH